MPTLVAGTPTERLIYTTGSDPVRTKLAPHQSVTPIPISQALGLIATACNQDERFRGAGVEESDTTIGVLLESLAFDTALSKLGPRSLPATLGSVVAAVFVCRVAEKRIPKRSLAHH